MHRTYQPIKKVCNRLEKNKSYSIFPKYVGDNICLWFDGKKLRAKTEYRELSLEDDCSNFYAQTRKQKEFLEFFKKNKLIELLGIWTLDKEDIGTFYIYDVRSIKDKKYKSYIEYVDLISPFELKYIPLFVEVTDSGLDEILDINELCKEFTEDQNVKIDGIMIKNYEDCFLSKSLFSDTHTHIIFNDDL